MRVKTLGAESDAERKLQSLQEECLDRAFHISMDRVNYRASDRGQVQEEQAHVLQELRELKNPEASPPSWDRHALVTSRRWQDVEAVWQSETLQARHDCSDLCDTAALNAC